MMQIRLLVCALSACLVQLAGAQTLPVDPSATRETKNLYAHLQQLSRQGTMFGHQDDLAYGVGWQYEPGRSDVKEVVGEYPAVFGWDLGHMELDKPVNLDSVPFAKTRTFIQQVYAQGGVNTISWHLNNPLDPTKTSWDKQDSTIRRLFADPEALKRYQSWLDKVAAFMTSLKGPKGELIPVIFRPFHEHTGSWFWWGREHCSPEEYKQMWRFTVDYLRKQKNVHNLLIGYSTDRFSSRQDYLERYPGDDYVDLVGFDIYHRPQEGKPDNFVAETRQMVETLRQIGQEKKKVWAITETGLGRLPLANWWTQTLLPVIKNAGLSYVLVWRNEGKRQFFAPYPGQASADNFKAFYKDPGLIFGKKVAAARVYGN